MLLLNWTEIGIRCLFFLGKQGGNLLWKCQHYMRGGETCVLKRVPVLVILVKLCLAVQGRLDRDGTFRMRKKGFPEFLLVCARTQEFLKKRFVLWPLKWQTSYWQTIHGVLAIQSPCPKVDLVPSLRLRKTTRTQCASLELSRRSGEAVRKMSASQSASATRCRTSWRVMTGHWLPCPLMRTEDWRTNLM